MLLFTEDWLDITDFPGLAVIVVTVAAAEGEVTAVVSRATWSMLVVPLSALSAAEGAALTVTATESKTPSTTAALNAHVIGLMTPEATEVESGRAVPVRKRGKGFRTPFSYNNSGRRAQPDTNLWTDNERVGKLVNEKTIAPTDPPTTRLTNWH